ncbi:MAG: LppM family (lipo)protein [Mycobacteriales bacterium]
MFRSRGPARRHRLTAAAALLLFALTGCIRYHVDATLHADDTVSGTVVVGMQKSLMEAAKAGGASSDDPSSDLKRAKFSRGKAQVKPYDKDGYSGAQLIVDNVPRQEFLAAMNGNGSATGATGDVLRIDKASGRYTVSGTLDLSDSALGGDGGDSGDSIPPALRKQLLSSFDIQIALTFPGKVLEHNGTLKGTTVTWKAKAGEKTVMHAVAEATGAGGASDSKKAAWKSPAAIGGGAVALLAIGGLIAFLLVRRRGGGGGQPAYAGAGVGPGPAAPGGYQPETPQAAYTPPPYTPPPAPTATGPEQPSPWAAGSPPASPYAAGGPAGTSPYAAGSGSSPYAAGSGGSPYATGGGTDEPTRRVPGEDPDHPTQALPQQGQDPDDPDGPQPWQFGR